MSDRPSSDAHQSPINQGTNAATNEPSQHAQPQNRFRFFPQLNDLSDQRWLRSNAKLSEKAAATHFGSNSLQDTLIRAIANQRGLSIKETMETFEFFARIRKTIKADCVADLCCGHGLLGLLFAVFERKVKRVILLDKFEPENRAKLIAAAASVAPWIVDKVETQQAKLDNAQTLLPPECSIISAHACGVLSDRCIDIAINKLGQLAILPCCYPKAACDAPLAIQTAFGLTAAYDIDRTYRLESAGYLVRWMEIPKLITPMNRILIARTNRPTTQQIESPSLAAPQQPT